MKFPEVALAVGDDLDESYHYILDRFIQAGFEPQTLEDITAQLPCRDSLRLFTLNSSSNLYIFVVVANPWSEELVIDVLNSLLSLRQFTQGPRMCFHFLTAHPLPPPLAYIFEDSFRGALECEALLEIRFDFDRAMDLERPSYLARQCQRWIQDHFHHTLYPHRLETLTWINQLILEQLRAPHAPDQPLDEIGYEPMNSLFALGCFVGEVILHQPKLEGRWVQGEPGLVIQVCPKQTPARSWFSWLEPPVPSPPPDWDQALTLNPIGKVIHLFREGEGEDLVLFAEIVLSQLDLS